MANPWQNDNALDRAIDNGARLHITTTAKGGRFHNTLERCIAIEVVIEVVVELSGPCE